jgi:hypothetical protein
VREWAFLRDIAHEHGDGTAHGLVDVDDENLVSVSEENGATATGGQHGANLHFDDRFVHPRKPYQPGRELQILPLMILTQRRVRKLRTRIRILTIQIS